MFDELNLSTLLSRHSLTLYLEHAQYSHNSHQTEQLSSSSNHQSVLLKLQAQREVCSTSTDLETLQDEVEEVRDDGQEIHNVETAPNKLPFLGSTEEPCQILWKWFIISLITWILTQFFFRYFRIKMKDKTW